MTRATNAFVHFRFALQPDISWAAAAGKPVRQTVTSSSVLTGRRLAGIDGMLASGSCKASVAYTLETIDRIQTLAAILTGITGALV